MTPPAGTAAATRTAQRAAPTTRKRAAVAAGGAPPRFNRRVSGPAAPARALRPGAVALPLPLGARLLRGVRALPEHRLLDRIARGRAWIPVVGVLLIGIVFTQVSLLSMNASIGAAVERGASLERSNGALRAQVAQLGSRERVEAAAGDLGLVMPAAGAVRYLAAPRMGDAAAAAQAIRALPSAGGATTTTAASQAPPATTQTQVQQPVAEPPAQQQAQAPTGTSTATSAQGVSGGGATQTAGAGQATPAPASGGVAAVGQGQ
jgi:hypothetical protein